MNIEVKPSEKQILEIAKVDIENRKYFLRAVKDLNVKLAPLAVKGELSKPVLDFYTELSRQNPVAGASSIWNFLIKK